MSPVEVSVNATVRGALPSVALTVRIPRAVRTVMWSVLVSCLAVGVRGRQGDGVVTAAA
jgi:hypothetical protein